MITKYEKKSVEEMTKKELRIFNAYGIAPYKFKNRNIVDFDNSKIDIKKKGNYLTKESVEIIFHYYNNCTLSKKDFVKFYHKRFGISKEKVNNVINRKRYTKFSDDIKEKNQNTVHEDEERLPVTDAVIRQIVIDYNNGMKIGDLQSRYNYKYKIAKSVVLQVIRRERYADITNDIPYKTNPRKVRVFITEELGQKIKDAFDVENMSVFTFSRKYCQDFGISLTSCSNYLYNHHEK